MLGSGGLDCSLDEGYKVKSAWNAFPLYANLGRYPAAGMAHKSLKNVTIRVASPVN